MQTSENTLSYVSCPICKIKNTWNEENIYRPFCSERCKNLDFGAWAHELYKMGEAEDEMPENIDETNSSQ